MTWNMHGAVRGAIQQINQDVEGTIYVSTGNTNVRGILTPTYSQADAWLQVQAQEHTPITHERNLNYTNAFLTIYAYGNFSDLERPSGKGGDVVTFNGNWYYISQVFEWWASGDQDWCSFEVTRQLNAADLATFLRNIRNGANPA